MNRRRLKLAIGVTAYNEERNLGRLLDVVCAARGVSFELTQIVVVISGSTDRSEAIAHRWATREDRLEVAIDQVRRGKATAVNQFLRRLRSDVDVCILAGGDLLPDPTAFEALVSPFFADDVAMVGARPVPTNERSSLVDRIVHLQWELHHRVSLVAPKMGELVAFRPDMPLLDPETVVDEAWLESVADSRGQRMVYAPRAIVYNRGPSTWRGLLNQRRRIWCGHLWLRSEHRYSVATADPLRLGALSLRHVMRHPSALPTVGVGAALEACARALGAWDFACGRKPFIWEQIQSAREPSRPPSAHPGR